MGGREGGKENKVGFRRAPCAKRIGFGISMALVQISQHFRKKKAAKKIWTFYGFGCSENTVLRILYDLGYILHSPKPLLFVCTFQYPAPKY